jgi:hypothetical protein
MPAGRPKIEIDWQQLDKLCALQCTRAEVACFFECSEDTIDRRIQEEKGINFAAYFEQKKGTGKIALRRKQYETAMAGSVPMLIFLGKQWLDQTDRTQVTQEKPVEISLNYKLGDSKNGNDSENANRTEPEDQGQ